MVDVKTAAARLGISRSLLYDMVSRREIPHRRVRSKILFDEAEIEAYLERCRVGPEPPRRDPAPPAAAGSFKHLDARRLHEAWKARGVSTP